MPITSFSDHAISGTMFVDIDSIYGYANTFEEVVNFLGKQSRWKLSNKMSHTKNVFSSRFGIDCRRLHNYPITRYGAKVKKMKFSDLPSLMMCQATIDNMNGVSFTIGFHLTGILNMRKSGYFCHLELAVILAAMNLSKLRLLERDDLTLTQRGEISKLSKFICDPKNDYVQNSRYLNADKMVLFVKEFEHCLGVLADEEIYEELNIDDFTGFTEKRFEKALLQKAALYLSRHHVITYSTSGIKNYFMRNPANAIKIEKGFANDEIEFGTLAFEKLMQRKANILLGQLNNYFNTMGTTRVPFFFDVGFELVPEISQLGYFINAGIGCEQLTEMLQ